MTYLCIVVWIPFYTLDHTQQNTVGKDHIDILQTLYSGSVFLRCCHTEMAPVPGMSYLNLVLIQSIPWSNGCQRWLEARPISKEMKVLKIENFPEELSFTEWVRICDRSIYNARILQYLVYNTVQLSTISTDENCLKTNCKKGLTQANGHPFRCTFVVDANHFLNILDWLVVFQKSIAPLRF